MFSSSKRVNSIVQKLLEPIEQGLWAAGQMLPGQRELAEQLEISRPSLREAITVLETLGVVRSLPGKGVMVLERRGQSLDEVRIPVAASATAEDVLQLRYALEPFIVGLVAQTVDDNALSQLRLLVLDMREAVEDRNPTAVASAYSAFHRKLVAITSNPIFLSVSQQIAGALEQSEGPALRDPEHAEQILEEHETILRAIRRHDSELASRAMRQHILNEGVRLNLDLRLPEA
ncbi:MULTISPECIES: FadR/GntR family transcriptional regulator [Pseudomonas]|uniref:Putative GntR family transcriptional regulator n=1 Tax=Metapseudomonas resinovorans NBRC 106553 TaxID=1245471 RepID=S6ARC8_METRE|nr:MULTISPECIES: FadR/GntR family transcriptional regulator [Pseudomonas]BAN46511.1 putative GntR family transcriptional regulator [Pseudomonas resinovorans NBRC 106553]